MVARFALPTLQHLHECLCPPLPWNTGSPGPVSAKAPTRPRTLRRAEALAKAASRATTPNEAERSLILTIFGHCGDTAFSQRGCQCAGKPYAPAFCCYDDDEDIRDATCDDAREWP